MLKLSVVGTGYLGATHAAAMSSLGFQVIGLDVDAQKIEMLKQGKVPFYEPDLEELLEAEVKIVWLRICLMLMLRLKMLLRMPSRVHWL
jgi:UDP-glucose 6-dehydrogenase